MRRSSQEGWESAGRNARNRALAYRRNMSNVNLFFHLQAAAAAAGVSKGTAARLAVCPPISHHSCVHCCGGGRFRVHDLTHVSLCIINPCCWCRCQCQCRCRCRCRWWYWFVGVGVDAGVGVYDVLVLGRGMCLFCFSPRWVVLPAIHAAAAAPPAAFEAEQLTSPHTSRNQNQAHTTIFVAMVIGTAVVEHLRKANQNTKKLLLLTGSLPTFPPHL